MILQIDNWLTRKKSNLQCMLGCHWCQVYLLASRLRVLHMSDKSKFSQKSWTTFDTFLCVLGRPPFLSFNRSSTKLKSPPSIMSSQMKLDKLLKNSEKKSGSSSLGAYVLAKVYYLPRYHILQNCHLDPQKRLGSAG